MQVTFYYNTSDRRKLRKSLTEITTVQCWIKDDCSLRRPTIRIERSALTSFKDVNYMYIDTFGRYYFISDDVATVGDFLFITAEDVDPLMSNVSPILGIQCVILRQEFKFNKYYVDDNFPVRQTRTYIWKKVGELPHIRSNILTVDGGKLEGE